MENQQQPYQPVPQQMPQPATVQYGKSCLAAAWDDLKASGNLWSKSAFLGLVSCVPVLNFAVTGYALEWAREVPFGGRTPLPQKCVTGRNFEMGFYAFVLSLVGGLVGAIVSSILSFVIIIGSLVGMALSLAIGAFVYVCQFRTVMMGSLGAGFQVKNVWEAINRNWGEFFLATLVPMVIAGALAAALGVVIFIIFMIMLIPATVGTVGMASMTDAAYMAAGAGFGMGVLVVVLLFVVLVYAMMVISVAMMLLSFRAVGHFIGRYAPEWVAEANAVAVPPAMPPYAPMQ